MKVAALSLLTSAWIFAACGALAPPTPTPAPSASFAAISISGTVTDLETGRPAEGVCVTVGRPGAFCWATTDKDGKFFIDGTGVIVPSQTEWELYFSKTGVYPAQPSGRFKLTGGRVIVDAALRR